MYPAYLSVEALEEAGRKPTSHPTEELEPVEKVAIHVAGYVARELDLPISDDAFIFETDTWDDPGDVVQLSAELIDVIDRTVNTPLHELEGLKPGYPRGYPSSQPSVKGKSTSKQASSSKKRKSTSKATGSSEKRK